MDNWYDIISNEMTKPYFAHLRQFVTEERKHYAVYPPAEQVFNSFNFCPFDKVKVVIVGQDPYHQKGQAMGLAFSVNRGVQIPPSLQNIFKEQGQNPKHGDLTYWAKQGVFLLNRVLTVRDSQAFSHQNQGWETFTTNILSYLYASDRPMVFMFWGKAAQALKPAITKENQLFLMTSHPSPLAVYRGFAGCKHFQKANDFLVSHNLEAIDWKLPDYN
ncbi:uracil-DNA glycosylase [Amygdalobacter nucleatus]|uniref:uracil-DNA glycosylase n=1 Tax=Amygdalobacter nucleatus TaxID=3029274 RepID=UPI000A452133|nr:uracil-DNA glycosylase [Amygdalobacter nucleatus]WEG36531.1 uracil-DNA glycosylase [Amygdalobacter nucleatus]